MSNPQNFVVIGIETRQDKGVVEPIDTLYFFESKPGFHSSDSGNVPKKKLEIGDSEKEYFTPHAIQCAGNELYILSRKNLWGGGSREIKLKKTIEEILGKLNLDDNRRNKLNEHKLLRGSLEKTAAGLYLAVYGAGENRYEEESTGEKRNVLLPGILLQSENGNFNDLTIVEGVHPTGRIIPRRSNGSVDGVIVPCGKTLHQHPDDYHRKPRMNGPITAAVHRDGMTISTDEEEGILLLDGERERARYQKNDDFHYFSAEQFSQRGRGNYLPSEASSVALVNHKEDKYALVGADDGKLLVYRLAVVANEPGLQYLKTLRFLSLEDCLFKDPSRDYHVRQVVEMIPGLIGLTIHNLWLGLTIEQVLRDTSDIRINFNPAREGTTNLEKLTSKNRLEQACVLPHRITSWAYHTERGKEEP